MLNYTLRRLADHPILTTADVKPFSPGFTVLGAFNPAACFFEGEVLLLLRVAEAPAPKPGVVQLPLLSLENDILNLTVKTFTEPDEPYDSRVFKHDGRAYLTSLSHLRLARSRDGINFTIDDTPFLFPDRLDESYGIEDARITYLDGTYWITYTAVSEHGPAVGLAKTTDFKHVTKTGVILPPPNKDVAFFPSTINGAYQLLHRPMVSDIGKPSIWLADSPDGIHWGNHRFLFGGRGHTETGFDWEGQKIGAGPEPLLTDDGWLLLYHGANDNHEYALALALLDTADPARILARSDKPLLTPDLTWEREGFFPNVVFSNGWVRFPEGHPNAGRIFVYYGAADSGVGLAELLRLPPTDPSNRSLPPTP